MGYFRFQNFLSITLGLIIASSAQAKTFKTQFLRFELPPNWSCSQEEQADWVCQSDNLAERSEAIVVVVTKEADEIDDVLEKYQEVLGAQRDMRDLVGNSYKSEVKYTRKRDIRNHTWIDALHFGSEIPGFYTRYVASIKEKVAGLITYSISETAYPKYAPLLDQMIESAEMFFDPKAFEEALKKGSLLAKRGKGLVGRTDPKELSSGPVDPAKTGTDMTQFICGLIFLAAIGYYIYKKKKG